jgi:hypothetical protein
MNDWLDHLSGTAGWEAFEKPEFVVALLCIIALVALYGSLPTSRRERRGRRAWSPRVIRPPAQRSDQDSWSDPKWQMEIISRVSFEPQRLLNASEYKVLVLLEAVVSEAADGFRFMAQTSLGEILKPRESSSNAEHAALAYRAINSKRVDFVIVDRRGMAVLAVEYQGYGHYQGNAFMRDAVKREVFRKAGVAFIEVPAEFCDEELSAQVRRILAAHAAAPKTTKVGNEPKPAACSAWVKRQPVN